MSEKGRERVRGGVKGTERTSVMAKGQASLPAACRCPYTRLLLLSLDVTGELEKMREGVCRCKSLNKRRCEGVLEGVRRVQEAL